MRAEIKAELDRIKGQHKNRLLEPKLVIAAARNKSNPLHGCFTWDVKKAAERYWVREAQNLISEYTVVVTTQKGESVKVRHYVSLTTDRINGGGYRALADVMNDEDMAQQLLDDALAELQIFQAKYSRLKQLKPVFDAIDAVQVTPRRKASRRQEARAH